MRIFQTLTAPIAAPVRKDTLEKESHAKVKLDYTLKKKQNSRLSQIIVLLSNKLARSNEQGFFPVLYDKPSKRKLSFHHYLENFSRKCGHARITTPPTK